MQEETTLIECLIEHTTAIGAGTTLGLILFYYGLGKYALREEIRLIANDNRYPYDGLRKLSIFKMVLFWPLQLYFAKKREDDKNREE